VALTMMSQDEAPYKQGHQGWFVLCADAENDPGMRDGPSPAVDLVE
jgi:invasion protein IalB